MNKMLYFCRTHRSLAPVSPFRRYVVLERWPMFAQCCRAADSKRRTLKFNIAVIHHHYFGGKLSMNCSLRNVIQCVAYVNFLSSVFES